MISYHDIAFSGDALGGFQKCKALYEDHLTHLTCWVNLTLAILSAVQGYHFSYLALQHNHVIVVNYLKLKQSFRQMVAVQLEVTEPTAHVNPVMWLHLQMILSWKRSVLQHMTPCGRVYQGYIM